MKMRTVAAALPLAAAVIAGGATASASAATTADPVSPTNVATQDAFEYTGEDFFWQSSCIDRGQEMYDDGMITAYRCDGSEWIGDDYSLFVIWNK